MRKADPPSISQDEVNHTDRISGSGFTLTEEDFRDLKKICKSWLRMQMLFPLSGSVPKGLDGTAYQRLVKIVKAGKPVILDTSGKLLDGDQACPTLINQTLMRSVC